MQPQRTRGSAVRARVAGWVRESKNGRKDAADFKRCRFSTIDPTTFAFIKLGILGLNFVQLAQTLCQGKVSELLWYLTDWGALTTVFAMYACFKATIYDEWHDTAVVWMELATALNVVIMPAFWLLLAPSIYSSLHWPWKGIELYIAFRMFTIHFFPWVWTTVMLILTPMEL